MNRLSEVFWKIGKIVELIEGNDGKVRACKVQMGSDDGKSNCILKRPLRLLIPLEINSRISTQQLAKSNTTASPPGSPREQKEPSVSDTVIRADTRPRRSAAVIGELLRRDVKI